MANEIQREDRGNVTILVAPNRLDAAWNEAVEQMFKNLTNERRFRVVIDCKQLRFLNSVIIENLVTFHQQASENGGDLKFANVSLFVEDVFSLSNLDKVFHTCDNIAYRPYFALFGFLSESSRLYRSGNRQLYPSTGYSHFTWWAVYDEA